MCVALRTGKDGRVQPREVSRKERAGQVARRAARLQEAAKKLSRDGVTVHWRCWTRRSPLRSVLAAMGGLSKEAWRARGEYLVDMQRAEKCSRTEWSMPRENRQQHQRRREGRSEARASRL